MKNFTGHMTKVEAPLYLSAFKDLQFDYEHDQKASNMFLSVVVSNAEFDEIERVLLTMEDGVQNDL